ncbi:N-acetylmuramoyl-L-alanine amidase family protein [Xylanibacter brevis]|uniref:N-acetylmuramoyl-L-alanine amidase family protein n=1 Tax=Xylanibacter brevis TaxID=83231 RepID=UPI0004864BAB|nr:N-acetylmuramoyl-L-alanine amidase [Xylanibacter brevis]
MLRKLLYTLFILLGVACTMTAAGKHRYTLVIDAGHGGKDAGALGKRSKEKNINLSVALAFGRYVEQNCPDVRVIYTRKTDVFIPLHERASIANRNKADVFISIHTNAVASKKPVSGLETYTMGMRRSDEKLSAAMRENDVVLIEQDYQQHYAGFDPRSPESYIIFEMINDDNMLESVELAKLIQKRVCATAGRPNKGVKQDAFLVLRETSMPACLIELGYITTASEEAYLTNPTNVDAMGRGIYQAFLEFKNKSQGITPALPTKTPAKVSQPVETPKVEETPAPAETAGQTEQEKPAEVVEAAATVKVEEPVVVKEKKPAVRTETTAPAVNTSAPVFKVQFLASDRQLRVGNERFKGLKDVESYKDGGLWKYTVGASTDYAQISEKRREVAKKFPEAFIVAFKDGVRISVQDAIREYKTNKK